MVIYGVALLAGCMLAGVFIGELLGDWIGVDANVGGVGIAMLLLVLATARLRATGRLRSVSAKGVTFWSAIYIPVVVAMAASQNVVAAVRGGTAAVLAGLLAVILKLCAGSRAEPDRGRASPPAPPSGRRGGSPVSQVLALMAEVMGRYGLITAFVVVGLTVWVSYQLSARLTRGQLHGSAIAIMLGLLAAYLGGLATGGTRGVADLEIFAGIGLMGGAMLRDFSIIATAFGVNTGELARAGVSGVVSLFVGVIVSFVIGAVVAYAFGYTDAVSMTTIGAGAATYIVGPVTGAAIGATSDVVALSIAAGLVKSMLVMAGTPLHCAAYRAQQSPCRDDLRWTHGDDERRRRWARRHGRAARPLRRDDGDLLYGARLPARSVRHLRLDPGHHGVILG